VRSEQVVDDYHGEPIPDPYRWLEDQDGDEVAEFVAAQNAATRAVLDAIPQRGPIEERLRELWNYARREPPVRRGGRWFWRQNDGLQNQDVLCCGDDPCGEGEVLLNTNAMSQDGTLAVSALSISHDGARTTPRAASEEEEAAAAAMVVAAAVAEPRTEAWPLPGILSPLIVLLCAS
jgi:prolyl oligopeptidase